MNRAVLVAAAVALAVVGAGAVFVGGLPLDGGTGPPGGGGPSDDGSGPSGGGDEPSGSPTASGGTGAYDFAIERIERCGTTCREVTAALANAGDRPRRNVRVTTRVYADGDLLWEGDESVGHLEPGESHTTAKRVNVGLAGGVKIRANGGYVTIVTVVESAGGSARFEQRRKVA